MKKILLIFLLILLPFITSGPVVATDLSAEKMPWCKAKTLDRRAQMLQAYLAQYNSPLQYSAQDFVEAADQYQLDWKLVAAISGVESTFGKFIPGGRELPYTSYNGWGWGVYGTQAIYFKSWQDGIYTVSRGLRENYFNKGYTDPYTINRIYAASPVWGAKVSYFLKDMAEFEKDYNFWVENPQFKVNIAGQSGLLALNQQF